MEEFEQLLAQHRNVLERFIRFRISNSFDADDIFQETCIGAYRNFDSLKDKALFKPWIISIARNKCNDYFRLMAKAMEIPIDEVSERHLPFGQWVSRQRVPWEKRCKSSGIRISRYFICTISASFPKTKLQSVWVSLWGL